jgi:transposase
MSRRNITDEFKAEAVQLVVAQGYSFAKASEAPGVGDTALRRWVARRAGMGGSQTIPVLS